MSPKELPNEREMVTITTKVDPVVSKMGVGNSLGSHEP
jgi:hypothetical protein